ncbi:MAG: SbmA/BacA-like family transporter, partial [Inquilinus sp.]|uniref:SbmA/BacA-like family transporter n=1 Tax=Inquilinus sp. TaxID=1932117 RepID=UPI003F306CBD
IWQIGKSIPCQTPDHLAPQIAPNRKNPSVSAALRPHQSSKYGTWVWALSDQVVFELDDGRPFSIPGYMVWCALIYAIAGSWLAWLIGRPLVRLNAERQNQEAELRSALARIHGSAEAIARLGTEPGEHGAARDIFASVTELSRQLANGVARLTWVTSGYGWLGLIVPVIAALPAYASGSLSLGGLMMVIGAFNQVQNALRWFVDNVDKIADWRARLQRVSSFRERLLALSTYPQDEIPVSIERRNVRVSDPRTTAARRAA